MTTSNERIASTGKNIQEKANLIWNVANTLFGAFKPHEYGLVILPMAVIKRFHDCLLPTHQAVLDKYKEVQHLAVKEGFLCAASGYQFYNISPFTFETLKADPENINENFRAFLNGFSDNVQDILARMNFHAQIDRMEEAGLLYQVVVDFCSEQGDMRPEKISAVDMGYIFENLVQRFSESYNEEAGAHFTSRDIIYLMCDLLVSNAKFDGDGISKTVYDMTMGTSQMLTCMEERLKQLDADADVTCFGQELNPFTFGIAKADMLIRGGDPDNMQFGNTLDDDKFSGYQFDYEISNPPFGIDWKREAPKVEAEHKKGGAGRFGPGLPSKSDGQKYNSLSGTKLRPNDIVYCLRGSVGKCAINTTLQRGTVASSLMSIRAERINPYFLLFVLLSDVISRQTGVYINGTCAANLSAENVGGFAVPFPPAQEQGQIAECLMRKGAMIDELIADKSKFIANLDTYKKSLIYEVVTGKRRVC